jgi:hypothetical protein
MDLDVPIPIGPLTERGDDDALTCLSVEVRDLEDRFVLGTSPSAAVSEKEETVSNRPPRPW